MPYLLSQFRHWYEGSWSDVASPITGPPKWQTKVERTGATDWKATATTGALRHWAGAQRLLQEGKHTEELANGLPSHLQSLTSPPYSARPAPRPQRCRRTARKVRAEN